MPSRTTHDLLTLASTPATYALGGVMLPDVPVIAGVVAAAAHVLSGTLLSPDLDVTVSRWGPLGVLWLPYMWLVPHRSALSHSFVLGPALRVAYLLLVLGALGYGLLWLLGQPDAWRPWYAAARVFLTPYTDYAGPTVAGSLTGSAAHVIPDWLSTAVKRRV